MANKRQLKKQIRYICGDLAGECILARQLMPNADKEKLNQAVVEIADLQEESLANATFAFDKSPRDFATLKEYNHAKYLYYRTAYEQLIKHFNDRVQDIVKLMNEAMPAAQKEANKAK